MKKSKVAIAVVLALVLVILCMNVPTFSWFSRGHSFAGEDMMMGDSGFINNSFTAYNGYNVGMETYASDDGVTYSGSPTSDFSGSDLLYNRRRYFCTTIDNTDSDSTDQNVSLYVKTLSIPKDNNGTLALGVNSPTRSYRDYSDLTKPSTKTTRDTMRIYFEKDNNVSGWNGTSFYICWKEGNFTDTTMGSDGTYTPLTHVGGTGYPHQYYADIPKTATRAFFCVENWGTNGSDGNNQPAPNYWQRSNIKNLTTDGQSQTSSKVYKITDTNNNGNATVVKYDVTGNCINSYYSHIFAAKVENGTSTFNAALSSGEYIGTLKYYSSNTGVFTVDEDTGVITPVAAGTATLYTKSQGGSYPDSQQVETDVTVTYAASSSSISYVFYDVPIVKNLKIPSGESVDVYWYVINNSATSSLRYTIDSIYLGM